MNNVTAKIWKKLDTSPSIRKDLSRGLINVRSLARYLRDQQNMDVHLSAIVSAIRRYNIDEYNEIFNKSVKILCNTTISTRSKLVIIGLVKDSEVQDILSKIFSVIHYDRGDVLRIIQADKSMKVLINENNLKKIKRLFPEKKILKIEKKLAEINMHLPEKAVTTLGIAGILTNELAINDINIVEIISCSPEILLVVNEENLSNAHQIICQLCYQK